MFLPVRKRCVFPVAILFAIAFFSSTIFAGQVVYTANHGASALGNTWVVFSEINANCFNLNTIVPPGASNVKVQLTMTGGDYDLYTRIGDNCPDLSNYECRPYLGGTNTESCTVSNCVSKTSIRVRKYSDGVGSITLTISWADPTVFSGFGNNTWNVLGYNDRNASPTITTLPSEYRGLYTQKLDATGNYGVNTELSFSSNASPSGAAAFNNINGIGTAWQGVGCGTVSSSNYTIIHKRKGFPVGMYNIVMEAWDDETYVFIDGVHQGFNGNTFWGPQIGGAVTFECKELNANSTIEIRTGAGGTLNRLRVRIERVTYADAGSDIEICFGESVKLEGSASSVSGTLLDSDFNSGADGFTSSGTGSMWERVNGFSNGGENITSGGTSFFRLQSDENINDGAVPYIAYLTSSAFSSVGYSNLKLNFRHYFRQSSPDWVNSDIYFEYSVDGSNWDSVNITESYTNNYRIGAPNNFKSVSFSLPPSIENSPNVYIRFKYINSNDWSWSIDDVKVTGDYSFVVWTPSESLNSSNILNPSASPASTTTYTLTVSNDCVFSDEVTVFVGDPTDPLTTISPESPQACHNNKLKLTASGGDYSSESVIVWQEGPCNIGYEQNWRSMLFNSQATIVNSVNGRLNVTSTSSDPMIFMSELGSFDPMIYRYVNIRYRVLAGTAGNVEIFFHNDNHSVAQTGETGFGALISDGEWHILSIDMHQDPDYLTGGNITGWRYDWATASGVTMDLDFISLDENPILAEGSNYITPSLTQTTTYYTSRRSDCGSTSCISNTITLPTYGSDLGNNNDIASCSVKEGDFIHFYESNGRLLASINSHGQNLGNVSVTSYVNTGPQTIITCGSPSDPYYSTATMGRHWVITPEFQPTSEVTINLPFSEEEYNALSALANSNLSSNLLGLVDLKLSKYSGANENHTFSDNCGNGITSLHTQIASGNVNEYLSGFDVDKMYASFEVTSFSEFWLHGSIGSALPVTLTDFSASCEKEIILNWTTASEQSSDYFVVEKSRDGKKWIFVAEQNAAGYSNKEIQYSQIDQDSWRNISYYRLRQVDFDGKQKVYGPISVECNRRKSDVKIYPNPTSGAFTIEISSNEIHSDVELQLTEMSGKVIVTQNVNIPAGTTQILIEESNLSNGAYLVSFRGADIQQKPIKVIVNR